MTVQKIAAFADGGVGGNPAGVLIADHLPGTDAMQAIAAEVGFSETAFVQPAGTGYRVRYFSPESEVPFCGHATIALGAALAAEKGDGVFVLDLNEAKITVEGNRTGGVMTAALQSPPTRSRAADPAMFAAVLDLFGIAVEALDPRIPPAVAEAGATHFVLAVKNRQTLADMRYDLDAGRDLMRAHGLVTISLVYAESAQRFHVRNPFASGGVYEDPATGAAAAALSGYLRDIRWPHGGAIEIVQGEDMGMRSLLHCAFSEEAGSSIRVSGATRVME